MHLDFLYPALFLLALQLSGSVLAAKPKNAILLSEVRSLTLRADKKTTHRRVPAVPQLKCVSPRSICALHQVETMQCRNQGSGYTQEDIQWACTASLPSTLKLGSTEVICEGYSNADDPYVLKGSCGVEYRLVLTDEGEKQHPNLGGSSGGDVDWSGYLFGVIFVAVLVWIIWGACTQYQTGRRPGAQPRRRGNGGGGGGGGGWGPGGGGGGGGFWDDPPPPYPGSKPSTQQGWQPGFWSGLASGAAAGYFAGNRGRRNDNYPQGNMWGGGPSYGTNWGSGGGSSSSSSSSATRHESTGFGSTSRR